MDEEEVKRLEAEVAELRRLRAEDAKANEKVVGIFATQEQAWITERRKLKLQIRALLGQFQVIEAKKEVEIAQLRADLEEADRNLRSRDEEHLKKLEALEEKLKFADEEKLQIEETLRSEAQQHSAELLGRETAFAEITSAHRQLEAEVDRVTQRTEALEAELGEAVARKEATEAAVGKLSEELEKAQRDAQHKDTILSAMLRKAKVDTAEKQVLVKELKALKARKRRAEMEAERWKSMAESRRRKVTRMGHSLEPECSRGRKGEPGRGRLEIRSRLRLLEYLDAESRKERGCNSTDDEQADDLFDQVLDKDNEELIMTDIRYLQEWVQTETERYAAAIEQRHSSEMEAFTEQMRVKDEKMEVLRWQFLTAELEMKQLQSHIEGLDGNLCRIREENVGLEAMLLEKEKELKSVKDRFALHMLNCRRNSNYQASSAFPECKDFAMEVRLRRRSREREKEAHVHSMKDPLKAEKKIHGRELIHAKGSHDLNTEVKQVNLDLQHKQAENCELQEASVPAEIANGRASFEGKEIAVEDAATNGTLKRNQIHECEIEEEKEVIVDRDHARPQIELQQESKAKRSLLGSELRDDADKQCTWKMDMQAMGVSYKLKRLKQQLVVLEKLAAKDLSQKPDCSEKRRTDDKRQPLKGFTLLMSLLDKQVKRYQSLEEKTNDLCTRMHESEQDRRGEDPLGVSVKEETRRLENFLEETFQLQRYMVATGQKMMEVQSRITCSIINGGDRLDDCPGINMGQFADIVRSLFRDVQRGLEVRIARIIGNIEGTLACEGIMHMRI